MTEIPSTTSSTGLIAIVRGVEPRDAAAVATTIALSGFNAIEVPLNSPDPLRSIALMREALGSTFAVGAGTVLTVQDVVAVRSAGAELVVSPDTQTDVIHATVESGMRSYPGAATPSEALAALRAGASGIKVFPSETIGIAGLRAWISVLPAGTDLIPVGGIDAQNMRSWVDAGATGAGIGSSLYRPGDDPGRPLAEKAVAIVKAWRSATESR